MTSFLQQKLTNVCNEMLSQQVINVKQSSTQMQIIEDVTFDPPPPGMCPAGTGPKNLVLSQKMEGAASVGIALGQLSTADLAQKLADATANHVREAGQDPGFAFLKNTVISVNTALRERRDVILQNNASQLEVKRNLRVTMPCTQGAISKGVLNSGNIIFSQEALLNMVSGDLARDALQTLRQSPEGQESLQKLLLKEEEEDAAIQRASA